MSEDDKKPTDDKPTAAPELPPPEYRDWFLQQLVELCNTSAVGFGFGITLTVGGTIISGNVVTGRRYFEAMAEDFGRGLAKALDGLAGAKEARDRTVALMKRLVGKAAENYGPPKDGENPPPVHYVHLENARIFHPGAEPLPGHEGEGTWFRVRVDRIDAFTFGLLSPD